MTKLRNLKPGDPFIITGYSNGGKKVTFRYIAEQFQDATVHCVCIDTGESIRFCRDVLVDHLPLVDSPLYKAMEDSDD